MYRLHHWQPRNWAEARQFLGDDDRDGGGGGNPKPSASGLLSQYNGDAVRMAEKLAEVLTDNATLRDQRRGLREEVTALKAKQAPEGATILQGEDAAAYEAYKALGKPADLTKRLADADTATQRLTTLERDATLRQVATEAKADLGVLRLLSGNLEYLVEDATDAQGKPTKAVFVKGEGGTKTALADYADRHWGEVKAKLFSPPPAADGSTGQGLSLPRQQFGGGQAPRDITSEFIAAQNEARSKAPNPLAPAAS